MRLLDRVLDGLEDGRLRGPFQTDGQAIILEDYLEIRPERRAQVERLAQAGKLVIGPWYVLPDEFLVSGESLIRNLRLGRQIARNFGAEPSNAGFVCDLFGHNSQMPQIFAGFGIRGGLHLARPQPSRRRGTCAGAAPTAPSCPATASPGGGYCDYTFQVRHALEHDTQTDRRLSARRPGQPTSSTRPSTPRSTRSCSSTAATTRNGTRRSTRRCSALSPTRADDFELVHTSLDAYLAEMLPQAGRIGAVVDGRAARAGPRCDDDQQWVIPGVLSSRVWIKQANADCQSLLCQWAEPFSALASPRSGRRSARRASSTWPGSGCSRTTRTTRSAAAASTSCTRT